MGVDACTTTFHLEQFTSLISNNYDVPDFGFGLTLLHVSPCPFPDFSIGSIKNILQSSINVA